MSLRNRFVVPFVLAVIAVLGACGSGGSAPIAPPSGGFSNSDLNGTYVFSTSGTDIDGNFIAMVGSLAANGSGGITAGTIDINTDDAGLLTAPVSFQPITGSSSYNVTADGRGQARLGTGTPLGTITLDFVLTSSSHGLITEFDGNGSGSGTLDAATTVSQSQLGSYAFSLAGLDQSGTDTPMQTVGAFTLDGSGAITSAVQDFNDFGYVYASEPLGGLVMLGSSGTTGTAQFGTLFGTFNFDFYVIDATHLKFIETDAQTAPVLTGDAFSQTSAAIPNGTMAFTMAGFGTNGPIAVGGFFTADGEGDIISGIEDANNAGTPSLVPFSLGGAYTFTGPRAAINLGGSFPGSSFAGYPSSGGLLLLEVDSNGTLSGSALTSQSGATVAASQGYGLNFTADNLAVQAEVDDIAEFTANDPSATPNMVGKIDDNFAPGGGSKTTSFNQTLSGTYTAPDSTGRGTLVVPSANTVNGGFGMTFYPVDSSNFLFIETDNTGQVAVGSFEAQTSSGAASRAFRHGAIVLPKLSAHAKWRGSKTKQ